MEEQNLTTTELLDLATKVVAQLEEEEGIFTDDSLQALEVFQGLAPSKLEALYYVQRRLSSDWELVDQEVSRLKARRSSLERQMAMVKTRAGDLLRAARDLGELDGVKEDGTGGRLKTPTMTAWLQRSTRVEGPQDVAMWPAKWVRSKTIQEPDRALARADLQNGDSSTLVTLVTEEQVRWR